MRKRQMGRKKGIIQNKIMTGTNLRRCPSIVSMGAILI